MGQSEGALVPARGTHSIVSCVLAAELAAPLTPLLLSALLLRYDQSEVLKPFFPRKSEQRGGVVLGVGPNAVGIQPADQLQSLIVERLGPDGALEWRMQATGQAIVVVCQAYTRWKPVSTQALLLLESWLSALPSMRVSGAGLQYVDELVWTGELKSLRPEFAFRKDSPLLAPRVQSVNSFWHNHLGWFEERTEPAAHRELINVNVNLLQQPERVVVQVVTTHRAALPVAVAAADAASLGGFFASMHESNKAQLRVLFSDAVQESIRLNKTSEG